MYCRKCGTQVDAHASSCPKCGFTQFVTPGGGGTPTVQATTPPPGASPAPAPPGGTGGPTVTQPRRTAAAAQPTGTNGFAIAALICGLLGAGLLGLIFGIVALTQMNKPENTTGGKGLAIAGIVLSLVLPLFILPAIMYPVFAKARTKAWTAGCMSNQRQLAVALSMYAQDNGEMLPPAERWNECLKTYIDDPAQYNCAATRTTGTQTAPDYGFNAGLGGKRLGNMSNPQTTLAFADGNSLLLRTAGDVDATRHTRTEFVAAYLDGHVAAVDGATPVELTVADNGMPPTGMAPMGSYGAPPTAPPTAP
jgi:hypothetical protein